MADIPNATSSVGASGYTCPTCGQWVNSYATAAHWCPQKAQPMFWPQGAPPTPLFPDPRLFALQEQIAKALERIADALEGLKPKPDPAKCGKRYTSIGGADLICNLPAEHNMDAGHMRVSE